MEKGGLNLETAKMPPSLTFYDLWPEIPIPNVKGFLNSVCFWRSCPTQQSDIENNWILLQFLTHSAS